MIWNLKTFNLGFSENDFIRGMKKRDRVKRLKLSFGKESLEKFNLE